MKTSVPPDKPRLCQRLLEATPRAEEKSNFGSAYTAVTGNLYSMISKYGVVGIRLPATLCHPSRSRARAQTAPGM